MLYFSGEATGQFKFTQTYSLLQLKLPTDVGVLLYLIKFLFLMICMLTGHLSSILILLFSDSFISKKNPQIIILVDNFCFWLTMFVFRLGHPYRCYYCFIIVLHFKNASLSFFYKVVIILQICWLILLSYKPDVFCSDL